jgi:hypothetical protein
MTTTVKCQHTGIEFQAASKRALNHPVVSAFLAKYNSDWKSYRGAGDEIKASLANVYGAYETAEEAVAAAEADYLAWRSGQTGIRAQMKAEAKAKAEARRAREATNAKLREHGYTWTRDNADGYQPVFGDDEWHLISADGREVTVSQALAEINK